MVKGVVFGNGYLGNRIADEFGYRVISRAVADASNRDEVDNVMDKLKPAIVINAVGKTSHPGSLGIDGCVGHELETKKSNVDAANNISLSCDKRGIYFVHIGSGCIYEGDNDGKGFSENDEPNFGGRQLYSDSKVEAERLLTQRPGLILRIRMPIDDRPHPRNLIDKLKGYPKVIDVPNSMTTVPDMISGLGQMIDKRLDGVYNMVNPGTITAAEIMERYKCLVNEEHVFGIMSLDELNNTVTQERSNCVLSSDKLERAGIILPDIHLAVDECLRSYGRVK